MSDQTSEQLKITNNLKQNQNKNEGELLNQYERKIYKLEILDQENKSIIQELQHKLQNAIQQENNANNKALQIQQDFNKRQIELDSKQFEQRETKQKYQELVQKYQKLKSLYDYTTIELNQKKNEIKEKFELEQNQNQSLKNEIESLNDKIFELNNLLSMKDNQIQYLQQYQQEKIYTENNKLNNQTFLSLDNIHKKQELEREVIKLKSQLEDIQNGKIELEKKNESQEMQMKSYQQKHENQLKSLQEEIFTQKQTIDQQKDKISDLNDQLKEVNFDYDQVSAQQKTQTENYNLQVQQMQQQIKEQGQQILNLGQKLMQEKEKTFDSALQNIPSERHYSQQIKEKLDKLQKEHNQVLDKYNKIKVEKSTLEKEIEKKMPLISLKKDQYIKMAENFSLLKEKLDSSLKQNNLFKKTAEEDQKTIRQQRSEIQVLQIQIQKMNKTIVYHSAIITLLQNWIRSKDTSFDLSKYTQDQLEYLRNNNQLVQKDEEYLLNLETAQQKITDLTNKLEFIETNNQANKEEEVKELKQRICLYQTENKQIKEQLERLQQVESIKFEIQQFNQKKNDIEEEQKTFQTLDDHNDIQKEKEQNEKNQGMGQTRLNILRKYHENRYSKMIKEREELKKQINKLELEFRKLKNQKESQGFLINALKKSKEIYEQQQEQREKQVTLYINQLNTNVEKVSSLENQVWKQKKEYQKILFQKVQLDERCQFLEQRISRLECNNTQVMKQSRSYFDQYQNEYKKSQNLMKILQQLKVLKDEKVKQEGQIAQFENQKQQQVLYNETEKIKQNLRHENQQLINMQTQSKIESLQKIIIEQEHCIKDYREKIYKQDLEKNNLSQLLQQDESKFILYEDQAFSNLKEFKQKLLKQKEAFEMQAKENHDLLTTIQDKFKTLQQNYESENEQSHQQFQQYLELRDKQVKEFQEILSTKEEELKKSISKEQYDILQQEFESFKQDKLQIIEEMKQITQKQHEENQKLSSIYSQNKEQKDVLENNIENKSSEIQLLATRFKLREESIKEILQNYKDQIEYLILQQKQAKQDQEKTKELPKQMEVEFDKQIDTEDIKNIDENMINQEIQQLQNVNTDQKNKILDQQNQIQYYVDQIKKYEKDLYDKSNQLDELEKQMQQVKKQEEIALNKTENESKQKENMLKELKQQTVQLEQEIQQLNQQIEKLNHIQEDLSLEEIEQIRNLVQGKQLIEYLEKAKFIFENGQDILKQNILINQNECNKNIQNNEQEQIEIDLSP